MLSLASCTKDILLPEEGGMTEVGADEGTGQMVMFSSGTTENERTRAGGAVTYYMPDTYRFVCRMYYKAQTGSDLFDVSGNTDFTAWLKVKGDLGNSLYWNKDYTPVDENVKGKGGVDDYGNDYGATAFYWQNRKEHAFLAWTDLNRAKTIKGGNAAGTLKFGKDLDYKVYTGDKTEQWVVTGYLIHGVGANFTSLSEMREYVEKHYTDDEAIESFNELQKEIGDAPGYKDTWNDRGVQYQYGWSCKHTVYATDGLVDIDPTHRTAKWYRYVMFFDKVEFSGTVSDYTPMYDASGIITHLKNDQGEYVAEAEVQNEKNSDGKYVDSEGNVIDPKTNPEKLIYKYYATDATGNVRYNEENPRYTFYYQRNEEKKTVEVYNEFPALKFDLKRGNKMNSMSDQPDIAQAREIQAPVGATQESNRVNLYFKHKFSQIHVNVKNSGDNSVVLARNDIAKVELLGVTEEGYIFTDLDSLGDVRAAAYKEIDFSKYTEQQLKDNPYGTSFQMFELPEADTETGYLKSFNAIAFGQLQAIRITWKEQGAGQYEHAATFRIPDTELVNLKSGYKYIWNIEVRRGTLAIIRTEIVDWELPDDELHNGNIDGTIQN